MSLRPIPSAALCLAFCLLAPAAPLSAQAAEPVRLTAEQQARLQALSQRVGDCHRSRAKAQAGTKLSADRIVAATLSACQARVTALRAEMVRLGGAEAADAALQRQRPRWEDGIRRNVAAERAQR
jgi:hypothetical protein